MPDTVSLLLPSIKLLFGLGSSFALSATGFFPKLGLGRALVLRWKNNFNSDLLNCTRKCEMDALRNTMKVLSKGEFIIVTGGIGYGKTCFINSTLHPHFGVVTISVSYYFYYYIYLIYL